MFGKENVLFSLYMTSRNFVSMTSLVALPLLVCVGHDLFRSISTAYNRKSIGCEGSARIASGQHGILELLMILPSH